MSLARIARPLTLAALACAALLTASPDAAHAQDAAPSADDAFKLRRLNHHLEFVRAEAEFGRKLGGGISLGLGIPAAGLGTYLLTQCEDGICTALGLALAVPGVLLTATGVLVLAIPGREETETARFITRAQADGADPLLARELVFDGERLLEDLAKSGRNARYIIGGFYIALGAIPLITGLSQRDDGDPYTSADLSSTLSSSALWIVLAAVSFAVTSDAEDALDAYNDEVERGLPSARAAQLRLAPSLLPDGGGLSASLTW